MAPESVWKQAGKNSEMIIKALCYLVNDFPFPIEYRLNDAAGPRFR